MNNKNLSYVLGAAYLLYPLILTSSMAFGPKCTQKVINISPRVFVGINPSTLTPSTHENVEKSNKGMDLFLLVVLQILLAAVYFLTNDKTWLIMFMVASGLYALVAFILLTKKSEDQDPVVESRKNWLWGTVVTSLLCIALPMWYNRNVEEVFGSGGDNTADIIKNIENIEVPAEQKISTLTALSAAAGNYKYGRMASGKWLKYEGKVPAPLTTAVTELDKILLSIAGQKINGKKANVTLGRFICEQLSLLAKKISPDSNISC